MLGLAYTPAHRDIRSVARLQIDGNGAQFGLHGSPRGHRFRAFYGPRRGPRPRQIRPLYAPKSTLTECEAHDAAEQFVVLEPFAHFGHGQGPCDRRQYRVNNDGSCSSMFCSFRARSGTVQRRVIRKTQRVNMTQSVQDNGCKYRDGRKKLKRARGAEPSIYERRRLYIGTNSYARRVVHTRYCHSPPPFTKCSLLHQTWA